MIPEGFPAEEYRRLLTMCEPKPHWSEASRSLVMRLRGIYAVGPNADQMGEGDEPEFGWRTYDGRPPIQFEAAQRIQDLEQEIAHYKEILDDLDYRPDF